MAYKFTISYETLDPERRDAILEDLIELIDQHRKGADTSKIKLQFTINNGPGGKTIIVQEQAIEPGQPIPDLSHFGQRPLTPMERVWEGTPVASPGGRAVDFLVNREKR